MECNGSEKAARGGGGACQSRAFTGGHHGERRRMQNPQTGPSEKGVQKELEGACSNPGIGAGRKERNSLKFLHTIYQMGGRKKGSSSEKKRRKVGECQGKKDGGGGKELETAAQRRVNRRRKKGRLDNKNVGHRVRGISGEHCQIQDPRSRPKAAN